MPEAANFEESNVALKAEGCHDLPVLQTGNRFYSCWKFSEEEIKQIVQTGKVWIGIIGYAHPPIMVLAEEPGEVTMQRAANKMSPEDQMRINQAQ